MTTLEELTRKIMQKYRVSRRQALQIAGTMGSSGLPQAPEAPVGVGAIAGDTIVQISWSSVYGADSYNIYWSTSSGVTPSTGTKITGVTSPYNHTGRTNGTPYYYVVTAVNDLGESNASEEVTATPVVGGALYYLRSLTITRNSAPDLTNFQVKVPLTSANMSFDNAAADGIDFRVWTDANKTAAVPYAIESWDSDAEQAVIWVKPASNDADLFIEYGNADYEESASDPATVFNYFQDFINTQTELMAAGTDSQWGSDYCPDNNRVYLFGNDRGTGPGEPCTQWVDLDTWEVGFGDHLPTPVHSAAVKWDPVLKRFNIYGGRKCTDGSRINAIQWYDPATNTSGTFTETLPVTLATNGIGYDPIGDEFFIFGGFTGSAYTNMIIHHNRDAGGGVGTCLDTGADLPYTMSGVAVIYDPDYSPSPRFILLGGGASSNSLNIIYTYDPASFGTPPVNTGHVLPETVMDLACARAADGVIYGFGGYNVGTASYRTTIVKYDGTDDATDIGDIPEGADDFRAFLRPSDENIIVGPVNHSDQASSNLDEYARAMLIFTVGTETLEDEVTWPSPYSGDQSTITNADFKSQLIGKSKIILSDLVASSTVGIVGCQVTFGAALVGLYTVECFVELQNKLKEIYLTATSSAGTPASTSTIGAMRTTSGTGNWQAWNGIGNQDVAAVPTHSQHIVGLHINTTAQTFSGSVARGTISTPRAYRTAALPFERILFHTRGDSADIFAMLDKIQVRRWVGVGGTEPTVTIGPELPQN